MSFIQKVKQAWARLNGRSTEVTYVALPLDSLIHEFLYKIGKNGKWKKGMITVQQQMVSGQSPVEIHIKTLTGGDWWSNGPNLLGKYYHYKILRNKNKIRQAVEECMTQLGVKADGASQG